jgi:hypothetical protein
MIDVPPAAKEGMMPFGNPDSDNMQPLPADSGLPEEKRHAEF